MAWIDAGAGRVIDGENRCVAECHQDWVENAPLIAAAPDLLNALKDMVDMFEGYKGFECLQAKAAIAKAEPHSQSGGQP